MEIENICGYVFFKGVRALQCFAVFIVMPILIVFTILMWRETFVRSETVTGHLLIVLPWTGLLIWLLWRQYEIRGFVNIQYYCAENQLKNQCKKVTKVLCWGEGFFVTSITLDFSIGKGFQELRFYIFSAEPFSDDGILSAGGLPAIKKLWEQNVLILPANVQTQAWVFQKLNQEQIPQYPKVSYFPPKTGDGL